MSKNKTRTKDKYRVVYTDTQRIELENEFRLNEYIAIPRKQEIAQKLKLSDRQIKIWFQNRRAKKRKQQKRKQSAVSTTTNTTANSSPTSTTSINISNPGSFGRLGGINSNRDSIRLELTGYSSPNEAGLVTSSSLLAPSAAPEATSGSDSQTTPPDMGPNSIVAGAGSQLCTTNVPETNSWHTQHHHPCPSTKLHLQTDHLQQQHHQMNQQLFHNHSQQLHSSDNTGSYTNNAYRHPNFPLHNTTTSLTDNRYYYNYDSAAPEAASGSDSQPTPPSIGPTTVVPSTDSQLCTNNIAETNSWHATHHHPCPSTKVHLQTDHLQQQHHQMNRHLFHNHSQQLHSSNNSHSYTNNSYRHSNFPLHNSATSLTDNPCYFNYDPAAPGATSLTNVIHNGNPLGKQSIYH